METRHSLNSLADAGHDSAPRGQAYVPAGFAPPKPRTPSGSDSTVEVDEAYIEWREPPPSAEPQRRKKLPFLLALLLVAAAFLYHELDVDQAAAISSRPAQIVPEQAPPSPGYGLAKVKALARMSQNPSLSEEGRRAIRRKFEASQEDLMRARMGGRLPSPPK